jgi:hypothetical protein
VQRQNSKLEAWSQGVQLNEQPPAMEAPLSLDIAWSARDTGRLVNLKAGEGTSRGRARGHVLSAAAAARAAGFPILHQLGSFSLPPFLRCIVF